MYASSINHMKPECQLAQTHLSTTRLQPHLAPATALHRVQQYTPRARCQVTSPGYSSSVFSFARVRSLPMQDEPPVWLEYECGAF